METNKEFLIFCQNIKYLRNQHHLFKKKMAQLLGIGVGSLTKLEHDVMPPMLNCNILFHIYYNFSIYPGDIFSPLNKKKD